MVTITKAVVGKKRTAHIAPLLAASAVFLLIIWVGISQIVWFSSDAKTAEGGDAAAATAGVAALVGDRPVRIGEPGRNAASPPDDEGASRDADARAVADQLDALSGLVPLQSAPRGGGGGGGAAGRGASEVEARFLAALRNECVPGRDDARGEINPTTKRRRECLRHVPLGNRRGGGGGGGAAGANDDGAELAGRVRRQRPRIGILVPPGFAARAFAGWAAQALEDTAGDAGHDVEVLVTSRVPVYGYGKSHGFSKLVRLVALPTALAVYDAVLWGTSASTPLEEARIGGDPDSLERDAPLLRDALAAPAPSSADVVGIALMLVLRWHCRLSRKFGPLCLRIATRRQRGCMDPSGVQLHCTKSSLLFQTKSSKYPSRDLIAVPFAQPSSGTPLCSRVIELRQRFRD